MALVNDGIVKLEWYRIGWFELRNLGEKVDSGKFVFGSKLYKTTSVKNKKVTVFFNGMGAWLWVSHRGSFREDIWTAKDLKIYLREHYNQGFPYRYEEYIPIIEQGESQCDMKVLKEFGLERAKFDIESRVKDLQPYNEFEIRDVETTKSK